MNRERDARLGTLARWFCNEWEVQRAGGSATPTSLDKIDISPPSFGRLGTVVVGAAYVKTAYSSDVADRSIDDRWQVC